jgi:hypothetical protein
MSQLLLIALHGTGDTYLACALAAQVERYHGRQVMLVVKKSHESIPKMFGIEFAVNDSLVREGENSGMLQLFHENDVRKATHIYLHPSFVRSGVRIDRLAVKAEVTHADLYRAMLHLPPDAPLAQPQLSFPTPPVQNTVLLLPEAQSWPNNQAAFWPHLAQRIEATGRTVIWNDASWTLEELFRRCAQTEWVIGPQCGVMTILCAAKYPCRKTFATPSIDGGRYDVVPVANTFPYAYVTKFAGFDYDVEEFKITSDNYEELATAIATGVNAQRLRPPRTEPVFSVLAPLSPGDACDRLAVLEVKSERFSTTLSAGIRRELDRYRHLTIGVPATLYGELLALHRESFDMHESFVRGALAGAPGLEDEHTAAVRLNRRRVELRQRIDAACGAATTEIKSYYDSAKKTVAPAK